MVIKKFNIIIGIFIFLNIILLSFASGATVAAWKDSYCKDCTLPWGGSIHSDLNKTAWLSSSVPCGSTCTSETRICSNGTLSGSYTSSSCYVEACEYCGDGLCNNGETYSSCPGDCPPTYVVYPNVATGTSCSQICASHGYSCASIGTDASGTDNCVNEYGTRGAEQCYWKQCDYTRSGYGWVGVPCENIIYPDDGNHAHAAGSCIPGIPLCIQSSCVGTGVFWMPTQATDCTTIGWCGVYFKMSTNCRCYY